MSDTQTEVRDNIVNYYMLPLLRLNKTSFGGEDNFINSYITKTAEIVVEIKDPSIAGLYYKHKHYKSDYEDDGKTVIFFDIPELFYDDYQLFIEGKYSKFSMFAKDEISKYSGLGINRVRTDLPKLPSGKYRLTTDRRILALSRDKLMRAELEAELEVRISEDAELISPPGIHNFYKTLNS